MTERVKIVKVALIGVGNNVSALVQGIALYRATGSQVGIRRPVLDGLSVGDIRVAFGRSAYHLVRASTSIGDVNTSTGDVSEGFLGKTLKYDGDGKYELRAHVSIGDISLEGR